MTRIHVLSPGFTNPNSCALLWPLSVFRREIKEIGCNLRVFYKDSPALTSCDILMIEHKALTKDWDEKKSLERLARYHEQTKVIWCDQSDSTGTFLGQVLPYVSRYLKAQILSDKTGYKRSYEGDRIYTNYYAQKHGLKDDIAYDYKPAETQEDLDKIGLSWNSGLMNHGLYGPYINRLLEYLPLKALMKFPRTLAVPSAARPHDLSCRMGISYPRATARFQREELQRILKAHLRTNKLSRREYFEELKTSKIALSPFGYGEITLKDFEVFLTGGALMKPDMSHLRTFPDFYEANVTYIPHSWDLDDVKTQINQALSDNEKRLEVAMKAQERFIKYTTSADAPALFLDHFQTMLDI